MGAAKNTVFSLGGQIAPLLVTLAVTPSYLHAIGGERYGMLVIAWLLLGYGSLFDLGMGRVTTQMISKIPINHNAKSRNVLNASLKVSMSLGIVGALIIGAVAYFLFPLMLSKATSLEQESRHAIPWLMLCIPITALSSPFMGVLQGRHEFLKLAIFNAANSSLQIVAPLLAAFYISATLPTLIAAACLARLFLSSILASLVYRLLVRHHKDESGNESIDNRGMIGLGTWMTLSSIISPILTALDRVLIGAVTGPSAVTYYNVPFSVARRMGMLPLSIQTVIYPRFASAGITKRSSLAETAVTILAAIMTPLTVGGILFSNTLLKMWVGSDFALHAFMIAPIIFIGVWFNAFGQIPYALLQATGEAHVVARYHLYELLPYLAALVALLHLFGPQGAAAAWTLRVGLDSALLMRRAKMLSHLLMLRTPFILISASLALAASGLPTSTFWILSTPILIATSIWSVNKTPKHILEILRKPGKNSPLD